MQNSPSESLDEKFLAAWGEVEKILRGKYAQSSLSKKHKIAKDKPVGSLRHAASMTHEIWKAFNGDVEGKRILDLGCGANQEWGSSARTELGYRWENERMSDETFSVDRQFEPWTCRALVELGAEPVGVDIGDLEEEAFEHHRLNLMKEGALQMFPDKSFDAVTTRLLFSSPSIEGFLLRPDGDQIKNEWLREIRRILKDEGKLLISEWEKQQLLKVSSPEELQTRTALWNCLNPKT